MRSERGKVIGVVIHIVTFPGLARSSVTSPIMVDDAIAMIQEEHHLRVPVIRTQRPAMAEDNGVSFSPVLVIDLCFVFFRDRRHNTSPFEYVPGKICGEFRMSLLRKFNRVTPRTLLIPFELV